MLRALLIFLILNFYSSVQSTPKAKVILMMENTNNLSFNFIQKIDGKSENGNCIIKYPKKIFCKYNNLNKKIIVSNGKSLVVQNKNIANYYIYPLSRTPLEFLLDKNYLISKLNILNPRSVDGKYLNFTVVEGDHVINIFFDKRTFDLVGWQTEDVYQNLIITFISSIKINQKIDNNIFILPKNN